MRPDELASDIATTSDVIVHALKWYESNGVVYDAVVLPNKEAQIKFLEDTNDNHVQTRPIWELMNRLEMFKNCEQDELTNAIRFADTVVNIPSGFRRNVKEC